MNRTEIIAALQQFKKQKTSEYHIDKIGVFGSVAKNRMTHESDIDIVVVLKEQNLFDLIGIKQDLEAVFRRPVDIVSYRKKMNEFLKRRIDSEAFYV